MLILGTFLIHATSVGCVLFLLGYGLLAPWWRSPIGRNLLLMVTALLAIFGLTSITLLFGTQWPARSFLRVGVAAFTCLAIWGLNLTLIRSQITRRRRQSVE